MTRGLCLGGGGIFFVAWQVAYLHALASEGLVLAAADKVVGTSAGSLVGVALSAGRIGRVQRELSVLARASSLFPGLSPSARLHPSQEHALDLFMKAGDDEPETIRAIGHAALAARTPSQNGMRRAIALAVGRTTWPSRALHITCVDAYSGERCVIDEDSHVGAAKAVAASCAVPGIAAAQQIGDRRCIDGGVSGTGMHLDLCAGAGRVLVLALHDGTDVTEAMATSAPGAARQELADLAASGTAVLVRTPEAFDVDELMSPASIPRALTMGSRQASLDRGELSAFWG